MEGRIAKGLGRIVGAVAEDGELGLEQLENDVYRWMRLDLAMKVANRAHALQHSLLTSIETIKYVKSGRQVDCGGRFEGQLWLGAY